MKKTKYTCETHLETLIDDLLDIDHQLPIIDKNVNQEKSCDICLKPATYMVTESEANLSWE